MTTKCKIYLNPLISQNQLDFKEVRKLFKSQYRGFPSILIQWLRIRLPIQGTWVQRSLVRKIPHALEQIKPVCYYYQSLQAIEPVLCKEEPQKKKMMAFENMTQWKHFLSHWLANRITAFPLGTMGDSTGSLILPNRVLIK